MKQAERTYLISDAAKQVKVEAHVLRYWEDELALLIKRNELGHRYYTQEDIARFKEVRDLKERGLQLKAIRSLLTRADVDLLRSDRESSRENGGDGNTEKYATIPMEGIKRHVLMVNKGELMPMQEESREAKSLRLQQLLQTMIAEAVRSSNQEVCEEIKESLLKELDYQFRLQEEREDEREQVRLDRQEEHYRKVDELIRSRNKARMLPEKSKDTSRKIDKLEIKETKRNTSTKRSEEKSSEEKSSEDKMGERMLQNVEKESGGEQKEKKFFLKRKKRSIG